MGHNRNVGQQDKGTQILSSINLYKNEERIKDS